MMDRRDFVRVLAGAAGASAISSSVSGTTVGAANRARALAASGIDRHSASEQPVGIQLYTVRRVMNQAPAQTLEALAKIGYREVQTAGLYGKSAREFRAMLDASGLTAPSAHIGLNALRTQLEQTLDDAELLGYRWIIVPSLDQKDRTISALTAIADEFNRIAEVVQKRGLRFGYHNHDFEFMPQNGTVPFDLLLERTDARLVHFELDLFWLRKGGRDPLPLFAKHPGRFPSVHVKDMAADGTMVNVGEGVIDFAGIFAQARIAGVQHYFVEHDNPAQPLRDVAVSFRAMGRLLGE